ncbi:sulfurtransferase TusA family protein, partial [Leclercia adecarboxylata]|uniref:sulfurtransferase TusA family protein n=1 Tax=Leclercia adecarboxylata TaxID=83655 RepID=UPI00234D49F3|nr:sulfurtransferase TusA family protein [Leclercia adecarboxylata]
AGRPAPGRLTRKERARAMEFDREVDARGLNCPLPILRAKKALAGMESGQLLKVVATDTGSLRDFQAFARQTGNELVEQRTEGEEFIHLLRRR